jgi:hypothetical protein
MKFILSLVLILIISCAPYIFAVSLPDSNISIGKVDIAKVSAYKLQQKILLSEEQTAKVNEILSDYLEKNSSTDNNFVSVQDKINGFLDQKQKAKFEIIKNNWWNSFLKGIKKFPAK